MKLNVEWLSAPDVVPREHEATWGRLYLPIEGGSPLRLVDFTSKTVRESLYLSVYPLAEWLACNWWVLLNEVYSPVRSTEEEYRFRHCILDASGGYVLPRLWILPQGERVTVEWEPRATEHASISFIGAGRISLARKRLVAELSAFIDSVCARLEDLDLHDSLLQTEWKAIRSLDEDEEDFCAFAGRMGVDPFAMDDSLESILLEVGNKLAPETANELVSAAGPDSLGQELRVIERFLARRETGPRISKLGEIAKEFGQVAATDHEPWRQGYEAANQLRELLGLNGEALRSDVLLKKAMDAAGRALYSESKPSFHSCLSGIASLSSDFHLRVQVSHPTAAGRRFTWCRTLFSVLAGQNAHGLFLATAAHTPEQQASRAFAAEFLAPRSSICARIGRGGASEENIESLAIEFGVSPQVIRHQIENTDR